MPEDKTPLYAVQAQVPTTDLGPAGAYVDGVRVTFRTRSGAVGTIFVPHSDYTVENVRKMIVERAGVLEGVAALEG